VSSTGESAKGDIIVHVFGKTDVGRTREHNEDAFVVADLTTMNATLQPEVRTHRPGERGTLFMVADGMGGAAAGEIASALATKVVLDELDTRWRQASDTDPETFARALKAACESANARINRYAAEHPENRGMGTTATVAGFLGDTLYLAQVGDSRAYLVRGGYATQITKDQSLMQKLVEAGELTAEEAEVSERRNIILQALGPELVVKVDLTSQQVRRGDTLVLCSDGLSGQVRADDIARIVDEDPDLVEACRKLIDLANNNGGPDNITVIAVRFDGSGLEIAPAGEGVGYQAYTGHAGERVTQPVDVSSIPAMDRAEAPAEPPRYPEPAAPMARPGRLEDPGVPHGAAPFDSASAAPDAARRFAPPSGSPRPGETRVSEATLRLVFGTIAVIIGAAVLYSLLRK
jgi:protein phosphatase